MVRTKTPDDADPSTAVPVLVHLAEHQAIRE
jgi:hypothetical protein